MMTDGTRTQVRPARLDADRVGVLVVDDGPDVRFLVRRLLDRARNFVVVGEAADGIEAIEAAEVLQPDVVLLDIAMPTMRGDDALPRIVAAAPHSMITVFSASITAARCRQLQSTGAFECYDKLQLARLPELLEEDYLRFRSR